MRPIWILLLLYSIPAAAQPGESWYRVVKTDNNIWDTASNLFITRHTATDTVAILGFTNQGARVRGFLKDGRIVVPHQTATITPYGGDGRSHWAVTVSATGVLSDSTLILQFYFRQDTFETSGSITARRWSAALDNARVRYQQAHPDTVINSIAYPIRLYDANNRLTALGQRYRHRVKNGRWIFFETDSTSYKEAGYRNDTLHGWYVEGLVRRSRGVYLHGVKAGRWVHEVKQGRRWMTEGFEDYDTEGRLLCKGETYPSGRSAKEIFYNTSGHAVWFIHFRKDGRIPYEGPVDVLPVLPESRE